MLLQRLRCLRAAVSKVRALAAAGLLAAVAAATLPVQAGEPLTRDELRWIAAGAPVLAWARQQGLAVDIIVQPTEHPELSPLSMAFIDGRCKLVLSMRGNPMVERHLRDVPAPLQGVLIEVMTAHEVGHCWRHAQGAWQALPAGFAPAATPSPATPLAASPSDQAQRREEGFADLVGLAWAWDRHPRLYAQIHAWLLRERQTDEGDSDTESAAAQPHGQGETEAPAHDTRAWVHLARDAGVFGAGDGRLFEQARVPWEAGLRSGR